MKICVITHTFPRFRNDPTAAFMDTLCRGLVKAGNKVFLLTPFDVLFSRENKPYQIITYRYIWPDRLHVLGYSRTLYGDVRLKKIVYLLAPFLFFFGFLALLRLVKKEKIDLICSHWILPNGFIAALVSKLTGVPFTVTLPGSDVFLAHKNKLFGKMAKGAGQEADAVLADSPQYMKSLLDLGVKTKISEIIPYPVDDKKLRPIKNGLARYRKKLHLNKKNLVILAVGRLVYKKGFNYLIQAMPPLVKKYSFIRLLIIGDGDQHSEWEALTHKLGINKYVGFLGMIDRKEISFYYNLADIFVMPSIKDKAGNIDDQPVSLIEAMACGKPVVATNFPGIAMTVKDNISGFLIPQKNVKMLTVFLGRLIESPSLREKMGRMGRLIVEKNLGCRKTGEKYTQVFRKVIKS